MALTKALRRNKKKQSPMVRTAQKHIGVSRKFHGACGANHDSGESRDEKNSELG